MIEFKNVSKTYGSTKALKNISFNIKNGQIFGLLGHNGAGKSTAIKILVSIITQTEGHILVDDELLEHNRTAIKQKIGYVADTPNIFLRLRANEYWELMATAYEIPTEQYQSRLDYYIKLFDMAGSIYDLIETFSHGMRQKTFLIGTLIANPKIWVLDEPMTGLDPQAAYDLKQLMREHADAGNIVLFSTHNLENAQELCDEIVILRQGEVLYNGTITNLQAQNKNDSLETIYLKMAGREAQNKSAQQMTDANAGDVN